jgi:hypothetical protein
MPGTAWEDFGKIRGPMKLTATSVRTAELPEGKSEAIFFDDDISGFGLRLRAQGSRTFIFQYKLGRAQYRLNLGKVEALNFAEVRKTALQYYASVKRGENPADDKAAALRQASETFKFYLDRISRRAAATLSAAVVY